jgi:hypothetical protein
MWWHAASAIVLFAIGAAALIWRKRSLRGTTLVAPWWWAMLSLLALAACEVWIAVAFPALDTLSASYHLHQAYAGQLRFLAAATTFCPLMAVLGAKRPQDRAWQWIVLSLLATLLLPIAVAMVYRPSRPLELHLAHRWFLAILLLMGWLNYLPTRSWAPGLLASAGQTLLFLDHLPLPVKYSPGQGGWQDYRFLGGMSFIVTAILLWSAQQGRRRNVTWPLDRVWLDFRDLFGAIWALRVAERFNAASTMQGWQVWLGWSGLIVGDEQTEGPPPPVEEAMHDQLRILLRRFVSPEWIAERIEKS